MPVLRSTGRYINAAIRLPASRTYRFPGRDGGVWPPLILLLVVISSALLLPLTVFGAADAETTGVFAILSWGDGDNQVGLAQAGEGLTRGPEALAVSPDGRVVILDSVNHRLVLLDSDGDLIGHIGLKLSQPRFLAVDDQTLYVLDADEDRQLVAYSWSGRIIEKTDVPRTDDVVTGLFATSDGAWVESGHRECFPAGCAAQALAAASGRNESQDTIRLPGRPLGRESTQFVDATFDSSKGVRIHTRSVDKADLGLGDPSESKPSLAGGCAVDHLVSLDSDGQGGLLVGARLLRPEKRGDVICALAITRLPAGEIDQDQGTAEQNRSRDEVLLLPESDFAYLGDPYAVAPDGRVFQPVADESGYTILIHSFKGVLP